MMLSFHANVFSLDNSSKAGKIRKRLCSVKGNFIQESKFCTPPDDSKKLKH